MTEVGNVCIAVADLQHEMDRAAVINSIAVTNCYMIVKPVDLGALLVSSLPHLLDPISVMEVGLLPRTTISKD